MFFFSILYPVVWFHSLMLRESFVCKLNEILQICVTCTWFLHQEHTRMDKIVGILWLMKKNSQKVTEIS